MQCLQFFFKAELLLSMTVKTMSNTIRSSNPRLRNCPHRKHYQPSRPRIIDCCGKIVLPGFIDTHRHLWQTQLKGRHANEQFQEYLLTGNLAVSLHSPNDVFWGELTGALENSGNMNKIGLYIISNES